MKDRKAGPDGKGTWTKTGVDAEGKDEFGVMDRKDARKSERKTRKAEKLRGKAEKLREKKGDKGEKRAARLEKRAGSKDIRADVKEKQASNIQQGKAKKADLVDKRGGQTPGMKHRVENPKKHDSEGKKIEGTGKKPSKEKTGGKSWDQAYKDRDMKTYGNLNKSEYVTEAKRQKTVHKKTGKWDYKNAPEKGKPVMMQDPKERKKEGPKEK